MSPERRLSPVLGRMSREKGDFGPPPETSEAITDELESLLAELADADVDSSALARDLAEEAQSDPTDTAELDGQPGAAATPERSANKNTWYNYAKDILKTGWALRKDYRNPLGESARVRVEVLSSITDSLADSLYHLSMKKAVRTIAVAPPLPKRGLMDRNATDEQFREKTYTIAAKLKKEKLATEDTKLRKLIFERLYFSDTRDATAKALVDYAGLRKGIDYVREEADDANPDHFRFYVKASGFAKLEAISDKDNTYNLSNISNILKERSAEAATDTDSGRKSPLRAANTLFCLHGDIRRFNETLGQKNGGFVVALIYRGPRTNYDDLEAVGGDEVDHIWEVEARHLHLEFMSVAIRQLREKVRIRLGGILNPAYYSPLQMKDDVQPAIETALAFGAARTLRRMSVDLDNFAGDVAQIAAEAETASEGYLKSFKKLGQAAIEAPSPPPVAEDFPLREIEEHSGKRTPRKGQTT